VSKNYEPDSKGLAQAARSKDMQRAMTGLARAAVAGVRSISPVVTGEYAGSFQVVETMARAGWRNEPRAAARIENTAPHASAVERKYKILSKAASIIEGGG